MLITTNAVLIRAIKQAGDAMAERYAGTNGLVREATRLCGLQGISPDQVRLMVRNWSHFSNATWHGVSTDDALRSCAR
jgi:hypothetical protein